MAKTKDFSIDEDNPVFHFLNKAATAEDIEKVKLSTKKLSTMSLTQIPEFRDIFPRDKKVFANIYADMQKNGFRDEEPIVYWKYNGKLVIVDGNTRYEVALAAGVTEVPAVKIDFPDFDTAVSYAKKRQLDRRNLTPQQVFFYSNAELGDNDESTGRTVEKIADKLGVSPATVQHNRTAMKRATEEEIEAVKKGEMSPAELYKKHKTEKKTSEKEHDEDDISDALEDTSENPKGLSTWDHHSERPHFNPAGEVEQAVAEKRESFLMGKAEGFKLGIRFALAEIQLGKDTKAILSDIASRELSTVVMDKLKLSIEQEEALKAFELNGSADGSDVVDNFDII